MSDAEFYQKYVDLLQKCLAKAECYQDWDDLHGKARYRGTVEYKEIVKFETENLARLMVLGLDATVST